MNQKQDRFRSDLVALIPRLRRFGFMLTSSAEDADDLVQVALEKALKNQSRWQAGTRLDSWMFRIMQNAQIDRHRTAQRQMTDTAPLDEISGYVSVDGRRAMEARQDLAIVATAMTELSQEYRSVLTLVALEGLSYKEVSDILDIPMGTVMSRLARARKTLSDHLNRELATGEIQ